MEGCEEQFRFNTKVEERKTVGYRGNLVTPFLDSILKAKQKVAKGKDFIEYRQKIIKIADGSEL